MALSFTPRAFVHGSINDSSILPVDVNGDGRSDIVLGGVALETLLSAGDGNFTGPSGIGFNVPYVTYVPGSYTPPPETSLPYTTFEPTPVVAVDANGDGSPDIAYGLQLRGTSYVGLSINEGNGQFASQPVLFAVPGLYIDDMKAGDLNGDGQPDLVVLTGNNTSTSLTVLLNKNDGLFVAGDSIGIGQFGGSLALGDFNGDGNLDAAVSEIQGGGVEVLLGDGKGNFTVGGTYGTSLGSDAGTVQAVSISGHLDLVVSTPTGFAVMVGDGHGGFLAPVTYSDGESPGSDPFAPYTTFADIDGNGNLDAVVSTFRSAYVLLGDGAGGFGPPIVVAAGLSNNPTGFDNGFANTLPLQTTVTDVNGDGRPDIVIDDPDGTGVVLLNTSGQSATAAVTAVTTSRASGVLGQGDGVSFGLAVGAPVTVQGAPVLLLNDGGTAAYDAAASSPTFLVFDHVVSGQQSAQALAIGAVSLPGGASITDAGGAPAGLAGAVRAFPALSVDTSTSADAVAGLRAVWEAMFSRNPTADELAILQGNLRSGLTLGQVRADAAVLPEATAGVTRSYAYVLNRVPSAIELGAALQALANGQQTQAGLQAGLAVGAESQGNLNQASLDILAHPLSAADAAAGTALLAQGASLGVARTTLALGAESQADIVATYQAYLGRAPNAQEVYVSTVQLASGLNQAGVAFQAMALASGPAVVGDAGSALLQGTARADVFVVGSNVQDTIAGFDFTRDLIEVSRAMLPNYAAVVAAERQTASGVVLQLDAQHSVLLQGMQAGQVFAANILFT